MLQGYYLVKYEGLNFERFLHFIVKNDIEIWDIKKRNYNEIYFKVSARNYKHKLLKHQEKWYNITIVKKYGLAKIKSIFFKRIGLVVGCACVIIISAIFSKTTFNYKITGCKNLTQRQIEQALENFGIKKGKINNFNNDDLEQYLLENLPEISLVSVMVKGNTLSVNIKEKEVGTVTVLQPITASHTMLITEANVSSGTLVVNVGDVVLKGKTLVEPYVVNSDGTKNPCKAVATIKGDIWFCGNIDFSEKELVLVRTGKKIVKSELVFGNKTILNKQPQLTFEYFEQKNTQSKIQNFFLPITFKKQIFYECRLQEIERSFESEKEALFAESKKLAYNSVPSGFVIVEEKQNVIKVDNVYKVQTYLKSSIEVTNEG